MFRGLNLSRTSRSWTLVVLAGIGGFVAGIAIFVLVGAGWIVQALTVDFAPVAAAVTATLFALAAMAVAGLVANVRLRAKYRLIRSALNNMTQGLCMFDGAARLVLCNERYIEMYSLQPECAHRGMPLRDLLVLRT